MLALATRSRGTALIVTMVAIMIIAGITAALFELTMLNSRAVQVEQDQMRAFQLAESAIDRARAVLVGSSDDNGQAIADLVRDAGTSSNSVEWDATTQSWVSYASGTWSSSSDVGLDGTAGTGDQGEGDGFPTVGDPSDSTKPGEPNVRMFRFGGNGTDSHLYTAYAVWWGNDGVDNNGDGDTDETDGDAYEMRTYTIRATGVFRNQVVELETLLTRDPPPDPVDPNNPPSGFLSAISVQVGANSGAPSGTVDFFNSSAANVITGIDSPTSITGAASASSTNDTDGIQLAASGASLTIDARNSGSVTGGGATSGSSYNNNGTFIGDIIDTIANGAKGYATNTSGLPSSNANEQDWGSASSLKVVYHDVDAHGPLEVGNGTATDTAGNTYDNSRNGFGILVVDVDTVTSTPPVSFAGANSAWEGIVIVRVKQNMAPSGPNGVVKATGSGSNPGQIGSVIVYAKDQADFSGGYVYKNNGNRPTQFSLGAIQEALKAFNTQVPPDDNSEISDPIVWRPIRQAGVRSGN